MYELWYKTRKGASMGKYFATEKEVIDAAKKLKTPATIKKNGELHGRVWKMNNRWVWYVGEATL